MDAKIINEACIEAAESCPQSRVFDFEEMGVEGSIDQLHQEGILAVIQYWRNPDTIGGSLLWGSGYYQSLPEDIQELFENVDNVVACAIKKFCEKEGV